MNEIIESYVDKIRVLYTVSLKLKNLDSDDTSQMLQLCLTYMGQLRTELNDWLNEYNNLP